MSGPYRDDREARHRAMRVSLRESFRPMVQDQIAEAARVRRVAEYLASCADMLVCWTCERVVDSPCNCERDE